MRSKFNGGQWTESRFNSFVKGGLRGVSKRWPPKFETLKSAYCGLQLNSKSGRIAKHYKCNSCSGAFPAKDVEVDHINPIINPQQGFVSWDEVVNSMFCEADNLQVLCKPCHKAKTKAERELSKKTKGK